MTIGLKPKQEQFINAFRSRQYRYLCAAGSAGSGKTFATLGLLHLLCNKINGMRFAILRKTEKNLRQTTIPSYNQVKSRTRSFNDSRLIDFVARYPETNSEILFIWADITKDPDLNNIKGLELTGALIEEANQIDPKYFHLLKTRVGRWNNHKCKPFIILNLNPSIGWVKDMFYSPWVDGSLTKPYYFLEFSTEDNDELDEEYIRGLEDLPEEEYKRYVKNIWDYSDIPNQLIKYEWYKQCCIEQYYIKKTDRCIQGIDPAWEGTDETVLGRMHGNHMGWWESYKKQDPDDTGILAFNKSQQFNIAPEDTVVDPIGVGAATVLKLRKDLNYPPTLFYAGGEVSTQNAYIQLRNKRSEAHWLFREALRKQEITLEHHPSLQRQALAVRYKVEEKKFIILPKVDIRKDIHESPGHLDVAIMMMHRYARSIAGLMTKLLERQNQRFIEERGERTHAQRSRIQLIKRSRIGV